MNLKSKKIGFRLFTLFNLAGMALDLLYFSLLCKTSGFDAVWYEILAHQLSDHLKRIN